MTLYAISLRNGEDDDDIVSNHHAIVDKVFSSKEKALAAMEHLDAQYEESDIIEIELDAIDTEDRFGWKWRALYNRTKKEITTQRVRWKIGVSTPIEALGVAWGDTEEDARKEAQKAVPFILFVNDTVEYAILKAARDGSLEKERRDRYQSTSYYRPDTIVEKICGISNDFIKAIKLIITGK